MSHTQKKYGTSALIAAALVAGATGLQAGTEDVADGVIAKQRAALAASTDGAGFGPQSPRDLSTLEGKNTRVFESAPVHTEMNLCDIHFHENAEHKGGEFTKYAGNGDGNGVGTGYLYAGALSDAERAPLGRKVGMSKYGHLEPGDTIEVHFVHTTAQTDPGPTLATCLSEAIMNPQLRVETQVMVLVNDAAARDFGDLAKIEQVADGRYQAPNIPTDTGAPIVYQGSTTGPSFNEKGSPFQVTWSVRPQVARVNIASLETWLGDNVFGETGAHGVRNLVTNPLLLSPIK